jgi:hypothetical protein
MYAQIYRLLVPLHIYPIGDGYSVYGCIGSFRNA